MTFPFNITREAKRSLKHKYLLFTLVSLPFVVVAAYLLLVGYDRSASHHLRNAQLYRHAASVSQTVGMTRLAAWCKKRSYESSHKHMQELCKNPLAIIRFSLPDAISVETGSQAIFDQCRRDNIYVIDGISFAHEIQSEFHLELRVAKEEEARLRDLLNGIRFKVTTAANTSSVNQVRSSQFIAIVDPQHRYERRESDNILPKR